jgi:hypothetical protein
LKVKRASHPQGDPGYRPLELSGARFLIPEQRGWPKWFVADTANNRDTNRWLISFVRAGAGQPWKATYLLVLDPKEMPRLRIGKDGYARAVPPKDPGLAVSPADLGAAFAGYLRTGGPRGRFADGAHTSRLRRERDRTAKTPKYVTQYVDQPVSGREYPPIALRTADGGALVLFTSQHSWKVTAARGTRLPASGSYTKVLMTGAPKRSVTRVGMAEQAAVVPRAGAGEVEIVNRIIGIVSAHGE